MKRDRTQTAQNNDSSSNASQEPLFLASDLAFPSDSPWGSLPCVVLHQHQHQHQHQRPSTHTSDGITSTTGVEPKILSYASFARCLELHRKWLANTIRTAISSCGERANTDTDTTTNTNDIDSDIHIHIDIVVAYISGNAPDTLLSVLACTSPSLKPAIPALLNTRWTPSEMVSSLRSYGGASARTKTKTVTIVLHDGSASLERVAHKVSKGLSEQTQTQTHNNHRSWCLAIPEFSRDWFEPRKPVPAVAASTGAPHRSVRDRIRKVSRSGSKSDALILFTSGTTGGSKGVRLSHRALLVQSLAKLGEPCGYSSATAMLATTVPIFHVGGLSSFLAVLLARGKLVFPARDTGSNSGSFRVDDIPRSIQNEHLPANTLVVVPAMLAAWFASDASSQQKQYPNTRCVLIGGQSASHETIRQLGHVFPNARIAQTYACTEAASSMTFLSLTNNNNNDDDDGGNEESSGRVDNGRSGRPPTMGGDCVGKPPDHIELRILPRNDGDEEGPNAASILKEHRGFITEPYQLGLIATRGPHVMNGYWKRGGSSSSNNNINNNNSSNNDDDNEGKSDRWFVGTDLGFWDETGRLWFGGRAKDVVRTGGETVLAREVEAVLSGHPGVAECAVFPRRDDRFGEAVAVAIVAVPPAAAVNGAFGDNGFLRPTPTLTLPAIKAWCEQHGLAGYKRPKFVVRVDSLPRNSSGKLLKHELVARFGNTNTNTNTTTTTTTTTSIARSKL